MPEPPRQNRRKLLSVKQVARLLDVRERTVYRLVKDGHLAPPRHVAGQAKWFPADIRVYLYRLRRGDFEDKGTPQRSVNPRSGATRRDAGESKQ